MVSYPSNFLSRPIDRDLLKRLEHIGCPPDTAQIMLYRIWQDFASGGSDRRMLDSDAVSAGDRAVELLEDFCKWQDTGLSPGLLVTLAVEADFLSIEASSGGAFLICRDFYPINSRFAAGGKSIQRKGALTRVQTREEDRAHASAERHAELWTRTRPDAVASLSREEIDRALIFIHTVCNCAAKAMPDDSQLLGGPVTTALRCMDETSEQDRKATLLFLISLRKDQSLPSNLPSILKAWPELVARARNEGV